MITHKTEALPEWKQIRVESTPPKSYACWQPGNPLGYVWANDLTEAELKASQRWPKLTNIKVQQYDGVF